MSGPHAKRLTEATALQVLQLHADATGAGVNWADYSHGVRPSSVAQPHSPPYGEQGVGFGRDYGHGDATDSPGSVSAMLTWAGAGMKQLASKLLGSSSPPSSQVVHLATPA
jgi:hypothetical protein